MLTTKITNKEKFNKVDSVDFSHSSKTIYNNSFDGNVFIKLKNGEEIDIDGEHSVKSWEDDFGFIVIEK